MAIKEDTKNRMSTKEGRERASTSHESRRNSARDEDPMEILNADD